MGDLLDRISVLAELNDACDRNSEPLSRRDDQPGDGYVTCLRLDRDGGRNCPDDRLVNANSLARRSGLVLVNDCRLSLRGNAVKNFGHDQHTTLTIHIVESECVLTLAEEGGSNLSLVSISVI